MPPFARSRGVFTKNRTPSRIRHTGPFSASTKASIVAGRRESLSYSPAVLPGVSGMRRSGPPFGHRTKRAGREAHARCRCRSPCGARGKKRLPTATWWISSSSNKPSGPFSTTVVRMPARITRHRSATQV